MDASGEAESETRCGCAAAVMDYRKWNVQNVLCQVRALHFKGSSRENGSCQHLRMCSNKMQPYSEREKTKPREKNDLSLLLKTSQSGEQPALTSPHRHVHQHTHTSGSLSSTLHVWWGQHRKTTQASSCPLRRIPQTVACLKALGFCEVLLDYSFAECNLAPLLFSTSPMLNSPCQASSPWFWGTEVNRFHFQFHSALVSLIPSPLVSFTQPPVTSPLAPSINADTLSAYIWSLSTCWDPY